MVLRAWYGWNGTRWPASCLSRRPDHASSFARRTPGPRPRKTLAGPLVPGRACAAVTKTATGAAARISSPAPQAMATANPCTTAAVEPAAAWAAR